MQELPTKPYFIRALHDWCTDNGYTPHIVVRVDEHTLVPAAHIHDGQITLNVGHLATSQLVLGNETITFQARFSGVVEDIVVPINAVAAIYARETGSGMGFEVATPSSGSPTSGPVTRTPPPENPDDDKPPQPPRLKIVK